MRQEPYLYSESRLDCGRTDEGVTGTLRTRFSSTRAKRMNIVKAHTADALGIKRKRCYIDLAPSDFSSTSDIHLECRLDTFNF